MDLTRFLHDIYLPVAKACELVRAPKNMRPVPNAAAAAPSGLKRTALPPVSGKAVQHVLPRDLPRRRALKGSRCCSRVGRHFMHFLDAR